MPAVSWVLLVLPEPAPAPSRTHRTHRDAARLRRASNGLDLQPRSILEKPVSDRGTLEDLSQSTDPIHAAVSR